MKFREDGTFHILHITDIQEIPEVAEDTLTLMRRALDAAKPDLVVFTGDQLKGYSEKFRKKPGQVEKTINRIMEPVVSRIFRIFAGSKTGRFNRRISYRGRQFRLCC